MVTQFLARFVQVLFDLMSFAILARVILSWVAMTGDRSGGRIKTVLYDITEPVLSVFRKAIPRLGMIDISPIVALLVIDFLKVVLISVIMSLGL